MTLADQIRQLCRRMYADQFTGKAPELLELADLAEALERDRDEAIEQALHFKSALIERAKGPAMTSPTLTPYIEALSAAAQAFGEHQYRSADAARLRAIAEALKGANPAWQSLNFPMTFRGPEDEPLDTMKPFWRAVWVIPAPTED